MWEAKAQSHMLPQTLPVLTCSCGACSLLATRRWCCCCCFCISHSCPSLSINIAFSSLKQALSRLQAILTPYNQHYCCCKYKMSNFTSSGVCNQTRIYGTWINWTMNYTRTDMTACVSLSCWETLFTRLCCCDMLHLNVNVLSVPVIWKNTSLTYIINPLQHKTVYKYWRQTNSDWFNSNHTTNHVNKPFAILFKY